MDSSAIGKLGTFQHTDAIRTAVKVVRVKPRNLSTNAVHAEERDTAYAPARNTKACSQTRSKQNSDGPLMKCSTNATPNSGSNLSLLSSRATGKSNWNTTNA